MQITAHNGRTVCPLHASCLRQQTQGARVLCSLEYHFEGRARCRVPRVRRRGWQACRTARGRLRCGASGRCCARPRVRGPWDLGLGSPPHRLRLTPGRSQVHKRAEKEENSAGGLRRAGCVCRRRINIGPRGAAWRTRALEGCSHLKHCGKGSAARGARGGAISRPCHPRHSARHFGRARDSACVTPGRHQLALNTPPPAPSSSAVRTRTIV